VRGTWLLASGRSRNYVPFGRPVARPLRHVLAVATASAIVLLAGAVPAPERPRTRLVVLPVSAPEVLIVDYHCAERRVHVRGGRVALEAGPEPVYASWSG
jgi:hypothetical protein